MSGKYNLTCFCEKCNTGGLATKSRKTATVGKTVAVHKDLYDLYGADHEIDINGIGKRYIHDIHGNSKNVIDIFVNYGSDGKCACSKKQNEKYNQKGVQVNF